MECIVLKDQCLRDNKFILGFVGIKQRKGLSSYYFICEPHSDIFCFICPSLESKYEFKCIEIT